MKIVYHRHIVAALDEKLITLFLWNAATPAAIKGLFISIFVMALNQFSGIFAILTYAGNILEACGTSMDIKYVLILIALINICGNITSFIVVDMAGRKVIILIIFNRFSQFSLISLDVPANINHWSGSVTRHPWLAFVLLLQWWRLRKLLLGPSFGAAGQHILSRAWHHQYGWIRHSGSSSRKGKLRRRNQIRMVTVIDLSCLYWLIADSWHWKHYQRGIAVLLRFRHIEGVSDITGEDSHLRHYVDFVWRVCCCDFDNHIRYAGN